MDLNSAIGFVIVLGSGMLLFSGIFWGGQTIMDSLGDESLPQAPEPTRADAGLPPNHRPSSTHVRSGEERLATQLERDEVDKIVGTAQAPLGR